MTGTPSRTLGRPWIIAAILLLFPSVAFADVGLPMLVLFLPGLAVLFVPIVLVEAAVARRCLSLGWRGSLRMAALANLASTLLGIPLTWGALLAVEWLVAATVNPAAWDGPWAGILALSWVAWLPPLDGSTAWVLWAAAAALCVPFFFASVWVEHLVATGTLGRERRTEIKRWAYRANLLSYAPITLALGILAVIQGLLVQ